MFLNYIKNIWLKKILKNKLHNSKCNSVVTATKSVGLLLDDSTNLNKNLLIDLLVRHGIDKHQIKIIVYKDKINKNEVYSDPTFGFDHLDSNGLFRPQVVNDFIQTPFDLLISYYDIEKMALVLLTNESKARFKAGFSTINTNLNHLIISSKLTDYEVFTNELFKYLKILKRI